jgi:bifunctional UDP-N-acetylglucosamine pyrophosphorylase/glucosamine-1-phosphate N-acetyltransferase
MGGDRPKVLFEANGKTLLGWVLGALSEAGVDSCVVVVGHCKEEVIATLPTGVRWAEQSPQFGTGHAVRCARDSFSDQRSDPLLVTYGDMPLVSPGTYRRLAGIIRAGNADAVMLTVSVPPESRFGRVIRNAGDGVDRVVEYKDATPGERGVSEGNAGVYCFRPAVLWPALEKVGNKNAQGEYYLPDVLPIIISEGGQVLASASDVPGEELGVNTPEDLSLAAKALADRFGVC